MKKTTSKWTRAQLKTIKNLAANMYVNSGYSFVRISEELEVSEQTLTRWAKGDEQNQPWTDQRIIVESTPVNIKSKLQLEINNIIKGEKPTLNADALNKLNSVLKTFTNSKNEVVIQNVFMEFNLWVSRQFPDKALEFARMQRMYLYHVINSKNG